MKDQSDNDIKASSVVAMITLTNNGLTIVNGMYAEPSAFTNNSYAASYGFSADSFKGDGVGWMMNSYGNYIITCNTNASSVGTPSDFVIKTYINGFLRDQQQGVAVGYGKYSYTVPFKLHAGDLILTYFSGRFGGTMTYQISGYNFPPNGTPDPLPEYPVANLSNSTFQRDTYYNVPPWYMNISDPNSYQTVVTNNTDKVAYNEAAWQVLQDGRVIVTLDLTTSLNGYSYAIEYVQNGQSVYHYYSNASSVVITEYFQCYAGDTIVVNATVYYQEYTTISFSPILSLSYQAKVS